MDKGAWWATVHGATKNWTQQKRFSPHTNRGKGLGTDASKMGNSWAHQEPPSSEITWGLLRTQSRGLRPSLQQSESVVVEL